ncbi:MAG: hypothetical protein K2W97_06445 [Chthoniobacterales bacterium]|nr:hypothetical protein [Chthoniobacterales bacterium]
MKTLLTLVLSTLLLTSTGLVAQTQSSSSPGYNFWSNNSFNFYGEANFPAQVEHTFHQDQSFDISFQLNSNESVELNETAFAAQSALDLSSATKMNYLTTNLDADLIKNPSTSDNFDMGSYSYYSYHFTPAAVGKSDIVFTATDKNGVAKTVTVSITIVP